MNSASKDFRGNLKRFIKDVELWFNAKENRDLFITHNFAIKVEFYEVELCFGST